jgi:hypothetical protein
MFVFTFNLFGTEICVTEIPQAPKILLKTFETLVCLEKNRGNTPSPMTSSITTQSNIQNHGVNCDTQQ